ncbi:MAG: zinc ABC transporter substrate-binding protein [Rhodospirillaceae bacterium]|nr:zinc ABC transporter substrate-binding protein [Rhodospirillaceae bacterium]
MVVSIKPVHALVAGVMDGVATPLLLVDGSASPHAYSLKPSQAAALAEADLVVWVGEGFEYFLEAPMESLVPEGHGLELADLSTIALLPVREGGVWDADDHGDGAADDHDHAEDDHDQADDEATHDNAHDGYDPHIWLDPDHAVAIVAAVAERLRSIDPANAGSYSDNEAALIEQLHALDAETQTMLAPLHDIPFIVFHDAYQYFERHYGLHAAGSITLDPEQKPGAARLAAIRDRLREGGVVCAFAEPGFDGALLETATEGTDVRLGQLDPEGIALEPGPALYPALIRDLAASLAACLAPTG